MAHAINDEALDTIFRAARTYNAWLDKPVSPALLMAVYDLMRWGPTAANTNPARVVFVVSKDAKGRLKPCIRKGNIEKAMAAPVNAIIGYDLDFARHLPRLFPHDAGAKEWFKEPAIAEKTARLSGTLQSAYFIIAARALGLDCGPIAGFDNEGVDREFFAGTAIKSNLLCNVGYGDQAGLFARGPRLSFDEACKIV